MIIMVLQIFKSFFNKINSFSKKTDCSITEMTEKSSNFTRGMAMIYVQDRSGLSSVWFWFFMADQAFIILKYYHLIILFIRNTIHSFQERCSLVFLELRLFKRIISSYFKSRMMTYFTLISPSRNHRRILMEFIERFLNETSFAGFEFINHN